MSRGDGGTTTSDGRHGDDIDGVIVAICFLVMKTTFDGKQFTSVLVRAYLSWLCRDIISLVDGVRR